MKSETFGYSLNSESQGGKTQHPLTRMDGNAEKVCLPTRGKFITEVYQRIIDRSINENLYSAPSRPLLRSAPDSCQAEKTVFNS